MKQLTFDQFTKKIYLRAPMEKIYWCWATEDGITSWFLRAADFSRQGKRIKPHQFVGPGDEYGWMWYNFDGQEKGRILEANGTNTVIFSFAGSCKVKIALEDVGKAVLLTLTQYDIPTDEDNKLKTHYGCSNGWTFWLANLKAYLEHGIVLNETDFDLRNEALAGYEYVNI